MAAEAPAKDRSALKSPRQVRIPGTRKVGGFMDEAGRMFSVGLEAVHTTLRRPWPFQEFIDQIWFLFKVTTVPVILISAYAEKDLRELLDDCPVVGFLPKSVVSRAAIDDLLGG